MAATSYDEVPYDSRPRYATHPDCLATAATLLGLTPPSVRSCRFLELGCASGGNLLPLAEALPEAVFVGVDLSPVQVDRGRQVAEALGMANLRLERRSILDLDESFGTFDYIVAHGVYSWVPAEVRDRLLWVCQHLLAPNGVAYVSYNTYPGWHLRAPVREILGYHIRQQTDPTRRIAEAREVLDFLVRSVPVPDSTWGKLLREEAEIVLPEGDYYLYHEHLEEENHAVYFHQFAEHARQHGLRFLSEAQDHALLSGYPAEVQQAIQGYARDRLELEQYLDFLKNRAFRRTLLVHDSLVLDPTRGADAVEHLLIGGQCRPTSDEPDLNSARPEEFSNENDVRVETASPLIKNALWVLFECWPTSLSLEELCGRIEQRLRQSIQPFRPLLARSLVQLHLAGLVGLHVHVPAFVTEVSERPTTTTLIRLQAKSGAIVVNRRHRQVKLTGLDRAVLSLLDGTRDRASLRRSLLEAVQAGQVDLLQQGRRLQDPEEIEALLQTPEVIETSLQNLAHSAVLVG